MSTRPRSTRSNQRRVALATVIGTTIEWYDFFIYATAAGLAFAQLFFEPAGSSIGLLLAFASVGISFLFRPLGAFLAGHYGDRIGRRAMLVLTLMLMGLSTALIGLLPTYETAGVLAPVLLLLLRILQGISAGGEWGGAVLMAVEHAPSTARGRAGAFPQLGVPLGLLLASGVTALLTGWIAPGEAFLQWGWRVPFLLSVVLIAVGYLVRQNVDESPVFREIAQSRTQSKVPVIELFRRHGLLVVVAALIFAGNNAAGYMATGGFIPSYATSPAVGLERTEVLLAVTYSAAMWLGFTYLAGILADKIGRKRTYLVGFTVQLLTCFPLFWLINTGSLLMLYLAMTLFTVGLGLAYGPQAALYSEMFPASVRFSGVSISYALGAVLGGAFAPTIATALVEATGGTAAVSWYLAGMTLLSMAAVAVVRDRSGIDLSIRNLAEQEAGATIFASSAPDPQLGESSKVPQ
ncbi:putative MFS family arabinose efflux permease [Glutamicibacter mysorens]|uniref:MFS family arabinose efflux permease n=1 Tax=Glutamicibacter mysorens TaxID=257984 RepID=A0ABX4N0U6_9MICC|nr:MFS transporter [Glutamicibacter mysorens]PJJ45425.1 putative MFS family arabinose efflux permease [Glutamicibacter mysorens]